MKCPSNYKYHVNLVALHITKVCSHKCPFCYAANDDIKLKHPSFKKLKRVIDALGEAKVKNLTLLGGDPACYPHVVDLAKYAAGYGMNVSIMSNTLTFPNSTLEEAAKYIVAFETTIHHADPIMHDKICGIKGAYHTVIKQLRSVSQLGRKTGIAINVTREIADKIYQLVNRIVNIEKVPLDYVVIQRIVPFGRAAKSSEFTLSNNVAEQALYEIKKIDIGLGIKIMVEDPFPLCTLPDELKSYMSPCEWGFTKASVNPDGDLSRCGADPRYRLGNILETPLLEIWNNSKILRSFRRRNYLAGRCKICNDFARCGGGCSLSCEIEKDHGIDYLFLEHEKYDKKIHGEITFSLAKEGELSSILQLEWGNFPGYRHVFTVESIKKWYNYNPKMFYVVRDSRKWVLGYTALVPISRKLFNDIVSGKFSALDNFPEKEVLRNEKTDYFHIEVLAAIPSAAVSRAGRYLIKSIGNYLLKYAKYVTTSPITEIGKRLCNYFGFKHVADEKIGEEIYGIYVYVLEVDNKVIAKKIMKF